MKQIKALVVIVDCHVITSTCACVNTMPRRQEGGIKEHEEEESVTVRGKFEGNEQFNQIVSYVLTYLLIYLLT